MESIRNPPGNWTCFISHTQQEEKAKLLASELFASLTHRGYAPWLDVKMRDKSELAMKEGVKNSKCCIVIMTDKYFTRPFCLKELAWAREAQVPVLPIVHVEDKPRIYELIQIAPSDDIREFIQSIDILHVDRSDIDMWNLGVDKVVSRMQVTVPEPVPRLIESDGTSWHGLAGIYDAQCESVSIVGVPDSDSDCLTVRSLGRTWLLHEHIEGCVYGDVICGEAVWQTTPSSTYTRTGKYVAIKKMNKRQIERCSSAGKFEDAVAEVEILRHLSQCQDKPDGIVQFQCVAHDANHIFLVLEFVSNNRRTRSTCTLLQYISEDAEGQKAKGGIEQSKTRHVLLELLDALDHLHARRIYHLDVSLENILMREDNTGIKLIDFGLAIRQPEAPTMHGELVRTGSLPSRPAGKHSYAAPELFR